MSRRPLLAALIGLTAVLALLAAGCGGGGSSSGGNATALPASSCSDIYYQGDGKPDYIVASDLPLQGWIDTASTWASGIMWRSQYTSSVIVKLDAPFVIGCSVLT